MHYNNITVCSNILKERGGDQETLILLRMTDLLQRTRRAQRDSAAQPQQAGLFGQYREV